MFTHVVMLKSQVLSPWKRRKTKTMVPPVATQIMEPSVKEVDVGSTKKSAFDQSVLEIQPMLVPCPTCTRTFLPDSLKKHSLVCQKIFISKRKVFDSSKKRVEGTDLALFNQKNYLKTSPAVTKKTPEILINNRRQPTWVEPHRQLVNTAKSKKGDALTETAPKMPLAAKKSPVSSVMASHQRCEYCDRQFGPKAFDRHVEWCKERAIRIPVNPTLSMAKERLQARIQYKTPPLKAPSRAVIREKYSPGIGRTDSMRNTKTSGVATATRPKNEKPAVKTTASRGEERRKPQHKVELIKTSSSSLSLKKCLPCEKINSIKVNETVEPSMTVAPLKLVGFPVKMVTWREICGQTSSPSPSSAVQEREVRVFYENRNFTRAESQETFFENKTNSSNFDTVRGPRTEDETVSSRDSESCVDLKIDLDDCGSFPNGFSCSETIRVKAEIGCITRELSTLTFRSSDSSRKSGKSSVLSVIEKVESKITSSTFRFVKDCNCVAFVKGLNALPDYEVPKKRRRLDFVGVNCNESQLWSTIDNSNCFNNINVRDEENFCGPKDDAQLKVGAKSKSSLLLVEDRSTSDNFLPKLNVSMRGEQREKLDFGCKFPDIVAPQITKKTKLFEARNKMDTHSHNNRMPVVKSDISYVFLKYKSQIVKPGSNARESVYDPFKSAERQFEELLRCDDFISTSVTRPRPATTVLPRATVVNCLEKSAVKSAGLPNKRASVIEPPPNFQDTIGADFEFQEALLNNDVDDDFFLNVDKPLEGREMERKYSDDMSSIDSNLINENDNLSIPEFLKMGGYWSTSTEDTVKSNDNVDHYSAEYDELFAAIEPSTTKETIAGNREGPGLFKPVPKLRNKNEANNCFLDREIANNNKPRKQVESTRGSRRKPEDVIAVDNDTFQQYMMYEERYLKEKKNNSNVRNQKQHAKQISSDSAYGRKTSQDQAKPPEPSPLEQLEIASVEAQPTTNVIARVEARPTTNVIASVEARPTTNVTVSMFCHECGTKYVLTTAKFCVVCGVRRLVL